MIQVKHIKKVTIFLLLLVTTLSLVACSKKDFVPNEGITDDVYASIGDDISITNKDLYNNFRRQSSEALPTLIEEKLLSGYLEGATKLLDAKDPKEDTMEEWAQNTFDELINQAIFSTTDVDSIKKIKIENRNLAIRQFADNLFLSDKTIDTDNLVTNLEKYVHDDIENDEDLFARGYFDLNREGANEVTVNILRDQNIIELQKRLYAEEILKANKDNKKKSDDYISKVQVINHYKSNEKGRTDANVFYFNFLSTNEANAAFRSLNVKRSSLDKYYRIPNIRNHELIDGGLPTNEIIDILTKDNYLTAAEAERRLTTLRETQNPEIEYQQNGITEADYKFFYENFNPTGNSSITSVLANNEVFDLFIELYNTVNDVKLIGTATKISDDKYDYSIVYDGVTDENGDPKKYDSVKTYDELNKFNSSLASYIYSSLSPENPYSNLRSVGNNRYLVFQLGANEAELDYVSYEKEKNEKTNAETEKWITLDELKAIYAEDPENIKKETTKKEYRENLITLLTQKGFITNDGDTVTDAQWKELTDKMDADIEIFEGRLFRNKLSSTYANNKVTAALDKSKVEIYDAIIRALYNQTATEAVKGSNKGGKVVLNFKLTDKDIEKFALNVDFEITTVEIFEHLEKSIGMTSVLDELVNKMLLKEYNSKDNGIFEGLTKEQLDPKEFDNEFKSLIKNFSNDQFASAGYPASIGREAFLLLMFGTTNKAEAIEKGFLVPQLRELYTSGFDVSHITKDDTDFDIYQFLSDFAKAQYEHAVGVSVSHLLVYYDFDGDGNPDNPEEYLDTLDNETKDTNGETELDRHFKLILELFNLIKQEAGINESLSTKLSNIITNEYDKSARIPLGFDEDLKWAKFKKAGLHLKFENLGSEITNTSNFITNQSTLDKVFYDRVMQLTARIQEQIDLAESEDENNSFLGNKGLPFFDMGGSLNENVDSAIINDGEEVLKLLANKQTSTDSNEEYGIQSSFGYHFILLESLSDKTSAKYDKDRDYNKDYTFEFEGAEGGKLDIYSDEDFITPRQIQYYVEGNKLEEGLLMPSELRTAFSKYYNPVLELFENQFTKSAMYFGLVNGVEFANPANANVFEQLRELNEVQFRGYISLDVNSKQYDANYADLYETWFTALNLY